MRGGLVPCRAASEFHCASEWIATGPEWTMGVGVPEGAIPLSMIDRSDLVKNITTSLALAALVAFPSALVGQDAVTGSLKGLHGVTKQNVVATAEMLSEDLYGYQPTEEVRTVGGLLTHIANSQYFFCSTAVGEASPNSENLEETLSSKEEIVAAVHASFEYCDGVYDRMTDAKGAEIREDFFGGMAVSAVLAFNSAHNYEHYGNLVTYMRLNGITPPSSMPQGTP